MKQPITAQQILEQNYDKDLLHEFCESFQHNGSSDPLEKTKIEYYIKQAYKKIDIFKQFKKLPEELGAHIESVIQNISTDSSHAFDKEEAICSLIGSIGHCEI